jgi:PAS domain S-box-containing protein
LGVPLKMEERVFGAIVVQSYYDPKCYTNADMEIMEFVANQISHMIDRQRAEEALLRSDKEFRQLFDDAPVGYHELDHEGRIVRVNQTELTSLGYAAEEILGHFVWEFLDDQEASRQSVLAKLSGTKLPAKGVERLYRRKDLTTITVVSEDIVLRDADGRITGIRTTLQDITELKRSEGKIRQQLSIIEETNVELAQARDKAMEASKTKSSFLANMSHELRTPLNAIIGYSEILLEEMHDVNEISYANDIDKIRIAGNNLLALINDILDLSKIEAGRMDLFIEEFSLQCLLKEIEATIKPLVDKKSNTLTIRQPEPSILLRLDQTKIRQILFNLLSNSCKFTERGEVTLAVGMDRSPAADAHDVVVFSVKDSGIGMTPEQMTKLFKEFSQADSSTTRKYGGTGLGLAITKRFCEMMKGTIEVQSVPMEGTTFTVTLPVSLDIQEHPSVASGVVLEDSTPVAPSAGRTVLIIDDDPNVRELLTRMFTKDGYSVQVAGSGNDGLAIARKILPMAIILDVMMPQKDGWAVLREIKDDPVLKSIPVIMHTIIDNRSLGFAIGAQDYLIKPVDHDKLLQTLARHKQFSRAMNILIIDDEPNQRDMLSRILLNDGWNVRTADGGQSALSLLAQSLPDVMILDLKMPTMDGFEFLKLVKEHDQWSSIPIIILSSMDLTKSVHDQLSGSVAAILRKGECNPKQLLAIVHRYGRPQAAAPRSEKEGTDENNSAR